MVKITSRNFNTFAARNTSMQSTRRPILFISIAFILLLGLSFLSKNFSAFGITFKNIDIISDILPAEDDNNPAKPDPMVSDSSGKIIADYRTTDAIVSYEGDTILKHFVESLQLLKKNKKGKVRIGYFGDSMIEGDLITQDFRSLLQDYFGGAGVGFVPITSIVAGFRQTIIHSFSENWNDRQFINSTKARRADLFLSGHAFYSSGSSVYYKPVNFSHLTSLQNCFLIYGGQDSTASFIVNGNETSFTKNNLINSQLIAESPENLRLGFPPLSKPIFGVSFESSIGVIVDNFSFRGISGMELQDFSSEMLRQIDSVHHYDLIIIQYGPNLLFKSELTDFNWYEKPMTAAVNKLKDAMPNTSILIVGTADKSARYSGVYKTQKGVEPLLEIQHRIAQNSGVAFWNLYYAMGGNGSMIRWVNNKPPLANVDYTHFTHKGATEIAHLLYEKIIHVYDPEAASFAQIQPSLRFVVYSPQP